MLLGWGGGLDAGSKALFIGLEGALPLYRDKEDREVEDENALDDTA